MIPKELKQLIREKVREGWSWKVGKHGKLIHPSGHVVGVSLSPSCPFFLEHVKADIKLLERRIATGQLPIGGRNAGDGKKSGSGEARGGGSQRVAM